MATQARHEPLRPPPVTDAVLPPPDPSDPPSKDDVDRALQFKNLVESTLSVPSLRASVEEVTSVTAYYLRVRERYDQSLGLGDITLADLMRETRQSFQRMNTRFDRLEQRMGGLEQRMGGLEQRMGGLEQRMGGLEQQMAVQVDTMTQFVANSVTGSQSNIELSRRQAMEFNRHATRNNRPGVEVPFLDGTKPSSKGMATLESAADVDQLDLAEARAIAVGHGLGQMRRNTEEQVKEHIKRQLNLVAN
ncbi:hypothetical protein V1506DRAFT_219791 [Lipomyces tetrasporus]